MHPGSRSGSSRWQCRLSRVMALSLSVFLALQSMVFAAPSALGHGVKGQGVKVAKGSGPSAVSRWPASGQQPAQVRVDPAVAAAFGANSQVTYLVQLRERVDVAAVGQAARHAAAPAQRDLAARTAVINALRRAAEQSQRGLLDALGREQAKGSVTRIEPYWIANVVLVTSSQDVMKRIAQRSDVAQILPNEQIHLVTPRVTTDDDPGALSVEWGVARIGAPLVWSDYGIDGTGTVVASLDTGVDWSHPALRDQWRGYDPGSGETDAAYSWFDAVESRDMPYDDHGHGTHTMGTIVGREPDGSNQIGVAPGARWIGVKILSASGSGDTGNILRAGEWILAPGGDPSKAPDVVNNSWGGGPGLSEWFRETVTAWRAAGIVPVFASGNTGPSSGSVSSPGNYPEAFTVGATDPSDGLAGFSGRGPSPYGEIKPEITAPGVNIRSSVPGGDYQGGWNGTSMAAPHVTGVVALLRQADAALSVDQIEQMLTDSADPMTSSSYPDIPNNGFGHGIVNAYTAVAMVADGVGTVSGRVLAGGDDLEPPGISHTPVAEGFKFTPIELGAETWDDVSVTSVQLRFRTPGMTWWGITDMSLSSGDHRYGTYQGTIPVEMTGADTVEYYIQATDFGGNRGYSGTPARPHSVSLNDGISAPYLLDFEGSVAGWTTGGQNDPWQIGAPTSGPENAYSGEMVAATNLSGDYPDNTSAFLLSPPIDLRSGTSALRFRHWYSLERNFDYGIVLVSGNGGWEWELLADFTGENGAWEEVVLDLSAYAGNPAVFVAFYLITDDSVTMPGWYIDDVELYQATEAPPAPTGLAAEASGTGAVTLQWEASASGEIDHYSLYRSTTSGSDRTLLGETAGLSFLDTATTAGETYYYAVSATDLFGNESELSAEATVTIPESIVRFFDDMEAGEGEWSHAGTGDQWQWGAPATGPDAAHSGVNVWATNLTGNYGNMADAALTSRPIDLSGLSNASLQFAHWFLIENGWDFGYVEVSADGSAWSPLATYTGDSGDWQVSLIDLTPYADQIIQLRFRLWSDSSVDDPGWYIDDLLVAGTTAGGGAVSRSLGVEFVPPTAAAKQKGKPTRPAVPQPQLQTNRHHPQATGKGTAQIAGLQAVSSIDSTDVGALALPLGATVTVLETERVIRTNPVNGNFSMTLPAREFTLRAESYGYLPQDRSVMVPEGGMISATFMLTPMERGQITGRVTDTMTGEPLAGVSLHLSTDSRVPPTTSDADGYYRIEALEGDHTVVARKGGYYPVAESIYVPGGLTVTVDFGMEPFVGTPGEIAYDDGTAENAWGFFEAGNGWGVRMSPSDPDGTVAVTAGRFYLWADTWPDPGGDSFRAAVYAANPDGTPGELLAGPVVVTGAERDAWNTVDFSEYGVMVSGDFYMVLLQDQDYPNIPGMAFDDTTRDSERNWQLVGGAWSPWTSGGNAMIRAVVQYAVGPPVITSPTDGAFTNAPELVVAGTTAAGTEVTLYRNSTKERLATPDAEGSWSAGVTLAEGSNMLTATATVAGDGLGSGTTPHSAPVTITLDTVVPTLSVTAPMDGSSQNSRIIAVSGHVADVNLAGVSVNGAAVAPETDGSFFLELVGQEGTNLLTVQALDDAGNESTVELTVHVDTMAPEIRNLEPATDQMLGTGDTLSVTFESEPELNLAAFEIVADLTTKAALLSTPSAMDLTLGEMAMAEVSPGRYQGQWTVPEGFSAPAAFVRVRAVDQGGNERRATAVGKIELVGGMAPTAVITGPTTGRVNDWLTFSGRSSSDPDGTIVAYNWSMGDGSVLRASAVRYLYANPGTYTITLTVTDNDGMSGSTTWTVQVRPRGTTIRAFAQASKAETTDPKPDVDTVAPEIRKLEPATDQVLGRGGTLSGKGRLVSGTVPVAVISGPTYGRVNDWLTFSGRSSYDPDGKPAAFSWNMGDGSVLRASAVRYRYTNPGTYTITLTVTDNDGMTGSTTRTVKVRSR